MCSIYSRLGHDMVTSVIYSRDFSRLISFLSKIVFNNFTMQICKTHVSLMMYSIEKSSDFIVCIPHTVGSN